MHLVSDDAETWILFWLMPQAMVEATGSVFLGAAWVKNGVYQHSQFSPFFFFFYSTSYCTVLGDWATTNLTRVHHTWPAHESTLATQPTSTVWAPCYN